MAMNRTFGLSAAIAGVTRKSGRSRKGKRMACTLATADILSDTQRQRKRHPHLALAGNLRSALTVSHRPQDSNPNACAQDAWLHAGCELALRAQPTRPA